MRLIKFLVVLAILASAAAYFTKPNELAAETELQNQLMTALANKEIDASRDTAGALALSLCKLQPKDCYQLIRSGIETKFGDHTLYTTFDFTGFGQHASCIGAFSRFYCPGGLQKD